MIIGLTIRHLTPIIFIMISRKAQKMSSAGHIKKSLEIGKEGQQRFYDSCRAAGKVIKKTSQEDDIKNHTDFIVEDVGFDVKGLKQTQKEGKVLLEINNVLGDMGWCNDKNKPSFIAFDYGSFFLCVKNKDLYKFAMSCDLEDKVGHIKDSLYKGYTRKNRKDLMTTVWLYDILNTCEHWFLPYEEFRSPMELL